MSGDQDEDVLGVRALETASRVAATTQVGAASSVDSVAHVGQVGRVEDANLGSVEGLSAAIRTGAVDAVGAQDILIGQIAASALGPAASPEQASSLSGS